MPVRQTERVWCFIPDCPYDRKSRGLCGTHYHQHRTEGLWSREVALFELEATYSPPTMGYYSYEKRLRTLAKSLPVDKKMKKRFVKAMLAAYRGGSE